MDLDVGVQFSTGKYACLCFTHAVQEAMNGKKVEVEVDSFGSEHDMWQTWCQRCCDDNYPLEEE